MEREPVMNTDAMLRRRLGKALAGILSALTDIMGNGRGMPAVSGKASVRIPYQPVSISALQSDFQTNAVAAFTPP
jgi:hypothetical protein